MSEILRLMTYNVRVGVQSDLAQLTAAIRRVGVPDVIAFQEIGDHWNMGESVDQTATLAGGLGLEFWTFAGALVDARDGRFGVSLASRWALDDTRVERLFRQEDEQRVLLHADLRHPRGVIRLLVTHLSVARPERLRQAARVGEAAAEAARRAPVIVLGDLNDRPGTPALRAAQGALWDCFEVCGEGPPETFSVEDPHRRIDYIFCGGGLHPVGEARVRRGATASDHFPLTACVGFDGRGGGNAPVICQGGTLS